MEENIQAKANTDFGKGMMANKKRFKDRHNQAENKYRKTSENSITFHSCNSEINVINQ